MLGRFQHTRWVKTWTYLGEDFIQVHDGSILVNERCAEKLSAILFFLQRTYPRTPRTDYIMFGLASKNSTTKQSENKQATVN